jgi:hypothetical protein
MKLPQFALRELFWLTAVCALAMGWAVASKQPQQLAWCAFLAAVFYGWSLVLLPHR